MISKSNQNKWFQIDLNRNHTNHEVIQEHNVGGIRQSRQVSECLH